jgi:Holliday junction DNA helicase RuvA
VTGVGPRLALAMLPSWPDELAAAVASGDLTALMKVPGIGVKGAERLVLELRDKMGMPCRTSRRRGLAGDRCGEEPWRAPVTEALVGLGWSAKQASDAVSAVAASRAG